MDRAYSGLTIKRVAEDLREIEGVATTPAVDRVGDVIEPKGIKYRNPLPLLWQHRHDQPVGTVMFSTPTAAGVRFKAKLPKIDEPGTLKDRVDEAWQSIVAGVVRAVSIGFRPLEGGAKPMAGGGIRFSAIEVLELSLVTVPANEEATISTFKRLDRAKPAVRPRALPPRKARNIVRTVSMLTPRQKIEREMADMRKAADDASKIIRRAETRDYPESEAHLYGDTAYQAAQKALGLISKKSGELADRLSAVMAGEPDPAVVKARAKAAAQPKPAATPAQPAVARPLPPVKNMKEPSRRIASPLPVMKRKDLVGSGERSVDDVLGVKDAVGLLERESSDRVEWAFSQARQLLGSSNRIFSFDDSTLTAIKAVLGSLDARVHVQTILGGLYRRELEVKLSDRLDAIEAKLATVKGGGLAYSGVYERSKSYPAGAAVTFDGSIWIAREDVDMNQPPLKSPAWQLAVKRGRDGKDATR